MKNTFYLLIAITLLSFTNIFSQYPNILIDNTGDPEEVSIAINPLNPNILAGGANLDNFYRSTTGGSTWIESQLISNTLGVWGDPVVLFDSSGILYYAHLSNPISGWWIDRIVVQRSTDNGLTWNDGVGIGLNVYPNAQDKAWLAVDHTRSPYRGNIYVTWTEFDEYGSSNPSDSSRIRFSKSTDQALTWSNAIVISDVSGNCIDSDETDEGAVPCVGPDGQIYVAWAGPVGIVFDKSDDGGETWGTDIFISDMPGGWDFAVSGIYRANGLPITMCDISNSPNRGNVYVVWSDQRNGATNTDIFISRSTNQGATWTSPIRVNNDSTSRHQFFVWSSVDPLTGYLWFVFYDRRNTTGAATDVFVAKSTDGGNTFDNFSISQSSFTPTESVFFGDYTNIIAWNGKIYPMWMRLQGNLSVLNSIIIDSVTVPVESIVQSINNFELSQNYPNPFNPTTTISFELPEEAFISLKVYDAIGTEVETIAEGKYAAGVHEVTFSAKNLSSGLYLYRIISENNVLTRKMILLK